MFEKNNLYGICVHMDLLEAFFTRKYHMTSHMSLLSSLNVREGVCLCTYNKQEKYTRQTPKETKNVGMDLTIHMSKQSIIQSECVQNPRISDISSRIKGENKMTTGVHDIKFPFFL